MLRFTDDLVEFDKVNTEGFIYLRLEGSIDALMSLRESVSDLNSNEFRSPPSARHCNKSGNSISLSLKYSTVYMDRNESRQQLSLTHILYLDL